MKKLVVVLLSLTAFGVGVVFAAENNPFEEKLPFKSATITYAISGLENGTETLYVDDYGSRSATYHTTSTTMMGMTMENNSIEIMDPEWVYSYDLVERSANKSRNPMKFMQEEFAKLSADEKKQVLKNREMIGMNVMDGMGGTVEQNATEMFGYSCDKMNAMGTTVYSIHKSSISLKTESDVMGMKMDIVATAVDTGKVDEKYFAHPAGFEPVHDEEADAMSLQMAQQTMAWLKDPEAPKKPMQMGAMDQSERMQHVPAEDQEMMKQMQEMMKGLQGGKGK